MNDVDNTIIATAIPRITDHFGTIDDIGWYGSAYLLTTCAFQLSYGKLYTFYSVKWVYLVAILIFEIGSAISGAAPTSAVLIVGRAIAGIGCAGIFSGTFTIIGFAVPLEKRPVFNGILGGVYGISSVAGPLMGGAFTDNVSWRWCFYINLPIGAAAFFVILLLFKSPPRAKQTQAGFRERFMQMDPIGTVFLIPGVVCLLLALTWGGTKYSWNDGRVIALLVVFGVCLIVFVADQLWSRENATVPGKLMSQRSVSGAAWFSFCTGGAFFLLIYFIPIWFQAIENVSAVQSGIRNLAMVLATVVSSILGGGLITAIGYYTPFLILSSILSAVGAGCLTLFTVNTTQSEWIGYQILYGLGVGLSMQTPIVAVQTVLSLEDIPAGTALIMFLQTLGGAIFVSIGQSIFTNKLFSGVTKVAGVQYAALVVGRGATEFRGFLPSDLLSSVLQAYNNALVQTWYSSVALATLSIFGAVVVEWKSVKQAAALGGVDEAAAAISADTHDEKDALRNQSPVASGSEKTIGQEA
ncbi:MFS general substrate transporter [Lepidopterella palustris CBS 459.81]|uniref:MFS general substrate transporter n=1 Tax=Lepidopterella palustris CBS 459.81 TaxID=1314670 RepID=A0A8E2EGW8_9PEZI|nr:MFS general substrate transporter [Lepidopterella palustris CBS 459.81]